MSLKNDFNEFNESDPLTKKLVVAALGRDLAEVAYCLGKGADPDAMVPDFGPLLVYAVRQGDLGLVERIVDAGPHLDKPDAEGETALMWAAHRGLEDIAAFLVGRGANALVRNNAGQSARDKAVEATREVALIDDRFRSIDDIENIFGRLTRTQGLLVEAEKTSQKTADLKAARLFHEGLTENLSVGTPFKLKSPVR